MKSIKIISFIFLGIAISWLTFGLALDLNPRNKSQNNLESVGVIYRANDTHKVTKSAEAELTELIKKSLAENPKTATLSLNITTVGSRITISGKAENKDQIKNAIQTALKIPGVKEVISTVVVDPAIEIAAKDPLL